MILKVPYTFLVKHFKKIHIGLAVATAYMIFKTFMIYRFFRNGALNNYYLALPYEQRNLYVNVLVLFLIILIIAALAGIYYLLNFKNKPRKIYFYMICYYVILFGYFLVLKGVFKDLLNETLEMQAIRAYTDVTVIAVIPQIAAFVYCVLSAFGVKVKRFNFEKDLKEIKAEEKEQDEVELNINFEGYKTKRRVRRKYREFGYYVAENRFIITCILTVVGVILSISIISMIIKYTTRFIENKATVNNKFTIKVEDSIISNLKPNGEKINNKYYVVVKLYIKNITNASVALDYSNYHLVYKKKNITPTLAASQNFYDFAMPYLGDEIKPDEERTIALAFEVDKADITSSFVLKVYKGSDTSKKKLKSNYNEVKLKPKKQFDIGDAARVKIGEDLSFVNSNVGNTTVNVSSYYLDSSYKYTYEVCNENICNPKTDIITPDYLSSSKSSYLMILDYQFNMDKDSVYNKYDGGFSRFVTDFMRVKYVKNGEIYYSNATSRTTDYITDKEIVQVDKDIIDADEIQLIFTIRNRNHIIVLK